MPKHTNPRHWGAQILLSTTAAMPMYCSTLPAFAADTPFGFQIGKPVADQLPECSNADAATMCVEPQEEDAYGKTYRLRHERNILGGSPQAVYLVETQQGIAQVQVVFPTQTVGLVKSILNHAYGEPAMQGELKLWDGYGYKPAALQHWVLEDGVITLQDATTQGDRAVAVIRSNQDFDRTLPLGSQAPDYLIAI
ncbi:MAG: hypothetical protein QE278_11195 [Limnobacter sp.]|nr:hypothetical protein [Limnobacter sp.]